MRPRQYGAQFLTAQYVVRGISAIVVRRWCCKGTCVLTTWLSFLPTMFKLPSGFWITRSPVRYPRKPRSSAHMTLSMNAWLVFWSSFRYPRPTIGPSINSSPTQPMGTRKLTSSGFTTQAWQLIGYPMFLASLFVVIQVLVIEATAHSLGP